MKKFVLTAMMVCSIACVILTGCGNKNINSNSDSTEASMTQLLEVLFHEPYLEQATFKTNCDSSREKLIPKIEKALQGEAYQINTESHLVSDYYAVTSEKGAYIYYGETKDNRPHGFGVLGTEVEGEISFIYAGEFKKGRYNGYGAEFFHSYKLVSFDEGGIDARLSTYINHYITYDGEWKLGYKNGNGNQYTIPHSLQGSALEGYWGGEVYPNVEVGSWKMGYQTGDFKIYNANVLVYDGHFKNGKADGSGTSYYSNGEVQYKGKWNDGEYDGKGTLYDDEGNKVYSGNWDAGDYAS